MLRQFCWSLCLLCLCVSCATVPKLKPTATVQMAEGEETVDSGCAYFYFLWGKTAQAERQYEEALEAYEKALVCDPEADYVQRELVVFYMKMRRTDDAQRLLAQLLAVHPDDVELLTLKAGLYVGMGQVDKAAAVYNDILAFAPHDTNTLLRLGSLYAGNRRYKEARQVLERLVAQDDGSFVGYQYLAKLYQQEGAYDKALVAYDKALALHWLPTLALEAAELLEFRKQYDKAVTFCQRILANEPDNAKARQQLVRVFLSMGDANGALAELRELRRHAVNVFDVDLTIGRLLVEQKEYDQAIKHFSSMLAADPDSGKIHYLLALAHGAKGNEQEAVRLLQQVTSADGIYEDAVMLRVELLVKGEKYAEAEKVLEQAIVDPVGRLPRFYEALASLYRHQGRNDDGQRIFSEALLLYPQDGSLHYEYALFLDRIGSSKEALVAMQEVLAIDANNPFALNYVGYTWADRGENLEQARKYIEQAVALRPADGFIRDSLGWVYFKLGDDARAVAELTKALELADDPVILEHLGDVHGQAGRDAEALKAYEQALLVFEKLADRQRLQGKIKALRSATH